MLAFFGASTMMSKSGVSCPSPPGYIYTPGCAYASLMHDRGGFLCFAFACEKLSRWSVGQWAACIAVVSLCLLVGYQIYPRSLQRESERSSHESFLARPDLGCCLPSERMGQVFLELFSISARKFAHCCL